MRSISSSARVFFVVPSLLGLLALALFPHGARAETSSEQVYHLAPPSAKSVGPTKTDHHVTPAEPKPAKQSTKPATEPQGEPESDERQRSTATTPNKGGDHPPGGDGGPGEGASPKPSDGSAGTSMSPPPGGSTPSNTDTSENQGGGGSSPVLPILIAVVVLAAVSIGVVLYRERTGNDKGDRDGPSSKQT
jgi:hypothetical protein